MAAYVLGLIVGALGLAAVVLFARTVVPTAPTAVCAGTLLAILALSFLPDRVAPRGSRWRVPQQWSRFGERKYAFLFGVSLGNGLATAQTTVGYLVVYAVAMTEVNPAPIVGEMFAFALGRAVPTLYAGYMSAARSAPPGLGRLGIRKRWAVIVVWTERLGIAALLLVVSGSGGLGH